MKSTLLLICLNLLLITSCHDEADNLCESLRKDLIEVNVPDVQAILNEWLAELPSSPTVEDPIGHNDNLNSFTDRLINVCDFDAEIGCYACIETFPVQSEVYIRLDSSGQEVLRVLDIRTPEGSLMTVQNVHQ